MMKWNGLPLVIFGDSGISKEVKCIIDEINNSASQNQYDFLGYICEDDSKINTMIGEDKVISSDEQFESFISKYALIGVVIPLGTPKIKMKIHESLSIYDNIVYPNIISPRANIMNLKRIELGFGNIITAGATLTTDIRLGCFNLININSTVGHDVIINDYCVINPLASISGNVTLESNVLIGAGASIKQGITIEKNSVVGLGALVVKSVSESNVVICEPARIMNKK